MNKNHAENLRRCEHSWLEPDFEGEDDHGEDDYCYEMMKDRELDKKLEDENGN